MGGRDTVGVDQQPVTGGARGAREQRERARSAARGSARRTVGSMISLFGVGRAAAAGALDRPPSLLELSLGQRGRDTVRCGVRVERLHQGAGLADARGCPHSDRPRPAAFRSGAQHNWTVLSGCPSRPSSEIRTSVMSVHRRRRLRRKLTTSTPLSSTTSFEANSRASTRMARAPASTDADSRSRPSTVPRIPPKTSEPSRTSGTIRRFAFHGLATRRAVVLASDGE